MKHNRIRCRELKRARRSVSGLCGTVPTASVVFGLNSVIPCIQHWTPDLSRQKVISRFSSHLWVREGVRHGRTAHGTSGPQRGDTKPVRRFVPFGSPDVSEMLTWTRRPPSSTQRRRSSAFREPHNCSLPSWSPARRSAAPGRGSRCIWLQV